MPVGAPAVQPSAAVSAVLVDINITAAELLTKFLSSVSLFPINAHTYEAYLACAHAFDFGYIDAAPCLFKPGRSRLPALGPA